MELLSQAVSPLALLVFVKAAKGENITKCVTSCQDEWEEMANRCYLWPEEKLSWAFLSKGAILTWAGGGGQ